jgi:hypothetical protein
MPCVTVHRCSGCFRPMNRRHHAQTRTTAIFPFPAILELSISNPNIRPSIPPNPYGYSRSEAAQETSSALIAATRRPGARKTLGLAGSVGRVESQTSSVAQEVRDDPADGSTGIIRRA